MDKKSDKPKIISITKEMGKIKEGKQPISECCKKKSISWLREIVISEKEAWSLLNTLAIVINRYTKLVKLIEDGIITETKTKQEQGSKKSSSLKTEKKYLSDFNFLYYELNKKYLDAYKRKKYYIFKEGLRDKEDREHFSERKTQR